MIKVENVTKVYKTDHNYVTAVKDISLTVNKGEIFGIIGFSGAGKSTLIRLLNGLEQVTSGQIFIGEQEITHLPRRDLLKARQKIAMIFQHFNLLWSRTVVENIEFPLEIAGVEKAQRHQRALELVRLVGLEGKENAYPSQLSGGQKQRVGIARALANDPDVLLCDEATSALDPKTTDDILDLILDINKKMGLTVVLITHEMHVISKICHRVAVMEKGKIVEMGEVLDVFNHPKQDITKRFVKEETDELDIDEMMTHLNLQAGQGTIIKFIFNGEAIDSPTISKLSRRYRVDISILHAKVTATSKGGYGSIIALVNHSTSEKSIVQQMIDDVNTATGMSAEVIRYV